MSIRSVLFVALGVFLFGSPAYAQWYPLPRSTAKPSAICEGCAGNNFYGQPNNGLPTWPYAPPLALHVGRYVDSSSTGQYSTGLRTVRAGMVRTSPDGQRIYLALGSLIGAYSTAEFLDTRVRRSPGLVSDIGTDHPHRGGNPPERATIPDSFVYPEYNLSGWSAPFMDGDDRLTDFDIDDRGYIYSTHGPLGWGISRDDGRTNRTHLPKIHQTYPYPGRKIAVVKVGSDYHAIVSDTSARQIVNVTNPSSPGPVTHLNGAVGDWSKSEAHARFALVTGDRYVRIYTYAALVAAGSPVAEFAPPVNGTPSISFDDEGVLWVVRRFSPLISRIDPSGDGYSESTINIEDPSFTPEKVHAAGGMVAIVGMSEGLPAVRLYRKNGAALELLASDFFRNYYHFAPQGYAQPSLTSPSGVRIVGHGGRTYLMYSAYGLGDVYQIGGSLITAPQVTGMAPAAGPPSGGTVVGIGGANFTLPLQVTFDGVQADPLLLNDNFIQVISPPHAAGPVQVQVTTGGQVLNVPQPFTYLLNTPATFQATAEGQSSVWLSVGSVHAATGYEFFRRNMDASWTLLGTSPTTSFRDSTVDAGKTYVYRARAVDADGNTSGFSQPDVASTVGMTQYPISGDSIKASDFHDAKMDVNSLRAAAGLAPIEFSVLVAPGQPITAAPILQLEAALNEARAALGLSLYQRPAWRVADVGKRVLADHISDIRIYTR